MLLRGRWLYLLLGAVVLILYVRLFARGPMTPPELVEQAMGKPAPQATFWEQELDPAKVLTMLQEKPKLALVLGVLTSLTIGLGISGVVLSVWAVFRRRLPHLFRYRSQLPRAWSLEELSRIVVLLVLLASLLPFVHISLMAWGFVRLADPHLWSVLSMVILDGLVLLVVWGFASTKEPSPFAALGLSWHRSARAAAQGLVGYTVIFPWVFGLLWLIVRLCQQFGIEPPLEPIHELLFVEERDLIVGLSLVLACGLGPVAEEVFFRGILFTAVRKHTSRLVAMLVSGALFAVVHTNLIGFLPILILGCLLADLYERTGSLLGPIAVHVLHNTLLVSLGFTLKELLV